MTKLQILFALSILALPALAAEAGVVVVEADRDATLIEQPDGELANGSGPSLFVGRTSQSQNGVRRAVVHFDVASALPKQALIESVSLTLYEAPSNPATREIRLHRVLADWGEGPSASSGGSGAPAEPGDVTWIHTFYDSGFWVHSGGQFVGRASATLEVAGSGFYTWGSTHPMVQDVRLWRSNPSRNFGWILIGDETEPQTSKNFASRERPDLALRPVLEITYGLPGLRKGMTRVDAD
jgi:hypothetical protein